MRPTTASPAIITPHIAASRAFYVEHIAARLVFDCDWFISLEFGPGLSLQFMAPQPDQPVCATAGLTYNFRVADVDATWQELLDSGLGQLDPPEDHPWGDRGFALTDPNGVTLYICSDREPAPEFRSAYLSRDDTRQGSRNIWKTCACIAAPSIPSWPGSGNLPWHPIRR